MSRIRTIKPEFWTSEQVMECSPLARLLFIGIWNFCDDQGVHPASTKTLKAEIFPSDSITVAEIAKLTHELLNQQLMVEFQSHGKAFWYVTGWHHQLIKNPSTPRHPTPPVLPQDYPSPTPVLGDDYPSPTPVLPQDYPSPTPVLPQDYPSPTPVLPQDYPSPTPVLPQDYPSPTPVLGDDYPPESKGREGKGRERRVKEGSIAASRRAPALKTPLPADLAITAELREWAAAHSYQNLERHLEAFKDKAIAKGYQYADWNAALRNAIRDDWAGLRTPHAKIQRPSAPIPPVQSPFRNPRADEFDAILRGGQANSGQLIEGELADAIH